MRMKVLSVLCFGAVVTGAPAQTVLPDVNVTEQSNVEHHGGYVISGDFQVDPRMSAVIFPSQALREGDILSVEPLKMPDDEYFVLQECASADCTQARILRVWGAFGATTLIHEPNRVSIQHEGKYFLWMKQIEAGPAPPDVQKHFTTFESLGPPLTLKPKGDLAAYSTTQLAAAENSGPVPVKTSRREEGSFVATFATGTVVRIKRLRAEG